MCSYYIAWHHGENGGIPPHPLFNSFEISLIAFISFRSVAVLLQVLIIADK